MVADALSMKENLGRRVMTLSITIHSHLTSQTKRAQSDALKPENVTNETLRGMDKNFESWEDGTYYFMNRIWVPKLVGFREIVMNKAHRTRYSVHLSLYKMYLDIKEHYWWPNMKAEIATYIGNCLTCAKVKVQYQKPLGLLQ